MAHPLAVFVAAESWRHATACPRGLKLGCSALFSVFRPQPQQNRLPIFLLRLVGEHFGSGQRPLEHWLVWEMAAALLLGPATAGP